MESLFEKEQADNAPMCSSSAGNSHTYTSTYTRLDLKHSLVEGNASGAVTDDLSIYESLNTGSTCSAARESCAAIGEWPAV